MECHRKKKHSTNKAEPLTIKCPHKSIDLWMDEVFITVLKRWPKAAPTIFLNMSQVLNGDEFALFLSGEANWSLRLKIILAMPKWIFLRAFLFCNPVNSRISKF